MYVFISHTDFAVSVAEVTVFYTLCSELSLQIWSQPPGTLHTPRSPPLLSDLRFSVSITQFCFHFLSFNRIHCAWFDAFSFSVAFLSGFCGEFIDRQWLAFLLIDLYVALCWWVIETFLLLWFDLYWNSVHVCPHFDQFMLVYLSEIVCIWA